jgi:CheY-like chemotaxis protein
MARILIVDDDEAIRKLLGDLLSLEGYYVQTAGSGSEAREICAAQPFDLVLADVTMPRMDGHSLARRLAVNHPSTQMALMSRMTRVAGRAAPTRPAANFSQSHSRRARCLNSYAILWSSLGQTASSHHTSSVRLWGLSGCAWAVECEQRKQRHAPNKVS